MLIYDFVDLNNRKIVEYNGDMYHANPNMFEASEYPHPFRKKHTAEYIWAKDDYKISIANQNGFDVLVIWDSEYRRNKKEVLQKCLDFLNQ